MEHANKIIHLMRQSNVLLRWFCLHTSREVFIFAHTATLTGQVQKCVLHELQFNRNTLYNLLLNCSQMELSVREFLAEIQQTKEERWTKSREEAMQRLNELSEAFAGSRPCPRLNRILSCSNGLAKLLDVSRNWN